MSPKNISLHSINSTKLSTHPRKNEKNSQFVMWDIAWNFGAPYAEEVNITQQLESMVANYLLCLAFNILYKGNYRHRYSCLYACSSTESARLVQSQKISDAEMANFFKGVVTIQNLILHLTGQ